MLEIPQIATGVEFNSDGLWYSSERGEISHPEECQNWYLAVEDDSYWFRHRAQCIVQWLRQFPPAGPILDVGGGNGHVSRAIQNAGFQAALLEPSIQGARNAKSRGVAPVICSTLQDAGLKDESLAAIGAFDVLEHIEDDLNTLQTMRQVLRPSGHLYLTVPAFSWLWSAYDVHVGHFRRYSLRSLGKVLKRAGFETLRMSYLFLPLPLPIFLCRTLPSRLRLRSGEDYQSFEREYAPKRSWGSRVLEWVLQRELRWVEAGHTVALGSSCLAVARAR